MKNLTKKISRGFTIIEVIIVLAIAGLILVIVLVAVPQLQRNTRDSARKGITNRVKAEMESYAANNQSIYPFGSATNYAGTACASGVTGCIQDFVGRYVAGGNINVKDPSTGADVLLGTTSTNGSPQAFSAALANIKKAQFFIVYGAKCNGENVQTAGGTIDLNTRSYAVVIGLDRDGTAYCQDNG